MAETRGEEAVGIARRAIIDMSPSVLFTERSHYLIEIFSRLARADG